MAARSTDRASAHRVAALFWHQEEPFGSTSIFAEWNVFKLARKTGVTVTLDGQGGDELLAGYLGFFPSHLADLATGLRWQQMRRELAAHAALHGVNTRWELRNVATNSLPTGLRARLKPRAVGGGAWLAPDFAAAAQADAGERWVVTRPGRTRLERSLAEALTFSPLPSLLRFDDRNSMAFSIESRVPFLDYRLIEFCCALPADQKIRDGVTKFVLRQAMAGIIPEAVRQRHEKSASARRRTPGCARSWRRGCARSSVRPISVLAPISSPPSC